MAPFIRLLRRRSRAERQGNHGTTIKYGVHSRWLQTCIPIRTLGANRVRGAARAATAMRVGAPRASARGLADRRTPLTRLRLNERAPYSATVLISSYPDHRAATGRAHILESFPGFRRPILSWAHTGRYALSVPPADSWLTCSAEWRHHLYAASASPSKARAPCLPATEEPGDRVGDPAARMGRRSNARPAGPRAIASHHARPGDRGLWSDRFGGWLRLHREGHEVSAPGARSMRRPAVSVRAVDRGRFPRLTDAGGVAAVARRASMRW